MEDAGKEGLGDGGDDEIGAEDGVDWGGGWDGGGVKGRGRL